MSPCKIHNVKFYKLNSNSIMCMAVEQTKNKLAVSRFDSTLEIWNLKHTPFIERTIPNRGNSNIEALSWYRGRLFSVGRLAHLTEYDLLNLGEKYSIPITGSIGWCMDIHSKTKKLAIGTEQGYLNLYEITQEEVNFEKLLDKQEGRIFCLKFDETGKFIATGSVDVVRVWKVDSGHAIHKMNLSRLANAMETVVWCLTVSENFSIISGDSRGFITVWDGVTGTQVESFRSHSAAVKAVCLSADKKTLYCSGTDPDIITYQQVITKGKGSQWIRSVQRNIYDHEVLSLVTFNNRLYSGGVDGYLACSSSTPKIFVKFPPILQTPFVSLARDSRMILLRYQKVIEVWQLGKETEEGGERVGMLQLQEQPKKLLTLQTKKDEGTLCAAISNNGQFIAYSTVTKLRLFYFVIEDGTPKLSLVENVSKEPCVRVEFTPDSNNLILAPKTGGLQVLNLDNLSVIQTTDRPQSFNTIAFLTISACGKYMVAADVESHISVWEQTNNGWVNSQNLPQYSAPLTALGIHPTSLYLFVVYANHRLIEYNLVNGSFTKFSLELRDNLPQQWLNRTVPTLNVTFDPRAKHIVFLHDDAAICVINKDKKLPQVDSKIPKLESSSSVADFEKKSQHSFHFLKKYKHLVYFDWLSEGEMVAVEVSPFSFLENLPAAYNRKKYATK